MESKQGKPQIIGNHYGDAILACIKCGRQVDLIPIAHRNDTDRVTGFVFACNWCYASVFNSTVEVRDGTQDTE